MSNISNNTCGHTRRRVHFGTVDFSPLSETLKQYLKMRKRERKSNSGVFLA